MIVGIDARPALFGATGFGRATRETIRALRARPGLTVRAFGAAWRSPRPDLGLPDVVRLPLPARAQSALAPLGFGVETLLGPIDLFHHTDLVYAPVRRAPQVLTIYDLVFLRGEPWHDPGFAARVAPRVRRAAARAAAIVVPSARVAEEVLAHGLAEAGRVHVVPLGTDHVSARPQPDDAARVQRLLAAGRAAGIATDSATNSATGGPAHPPVVLLPGTREPRKNQLAVLQAFLALGARARDAVLVLAGPRGWGCAELEAALADPALAGRVVAAGEVSEPDLGALLRRADVVCYPSFAEGFGLPAAEGMRCGRAVLTSADTTMADLGGDAVLAVDPRDGGALREALAALLADPARRAALGAAAAARAEPLTWAATAAALQAVYEQVAPGAGARAA